MLKRVVGIAAIVVAFLFFPAWSVWGQVPAPTPIPSGDVTGAVGVLSDIVKAFAAGNYGLAFGGVLMLLVFVTRTWLWKSISKEWIPLATAVLAAATATGAALWGGMDPWKAVADGVTVGISAVGLWELIKPLVKRATGVKA